MTDWKEGDEVIIVNYGSWNIRAYTDVINRLTKTQIVPRKHKGRFRRIDGRVTGDSSYAMIYPATDEGAQKTLREYRLYLAAKKVESEATEFAKDPTPATANAIALAVQYWEFLHDGEEVKP